MHSRRLFFVRASWLCGKWACGSNDYGGPSLQKSMSFHDHTNSFNFIQSEYIDVVPNCTTDVVVQNCSIEPRKSVIVFAAHKAE
jgi:hypothetical protein